LSVISAQTRRVCRERNPAATFSDHASGRGFINQSRFGPDQ